MERCRSTVLAQALLANRALSDPHQWSRIESRTPFNAQVLDEREDEVLQDFLFRVGATWRYPEADASLKPAMQPEQKLCATSGLQRGYPEA